MPCCSAVSVSRFVQLKNGEGMYLDLPHPHRTSLYTVLDAAFGKSTGWFKRDLKIRSPI